MATAEKVLATVEGLWDFEGADDEDLPFQAGDILEIVDQSDEDWWQASLHGRTGLIPSNYVQIVNRQGSTFGQAPAPVFAAACKSEVSEISQPSEVPVGLTSLEAFDDLMESGFTFVSNTTPSGATLIKEGQQVEVEYTLCIWDGSSSKAREAERAAGCTFTVGTLDPYFSPDIVSVEPSQGVPPPPGLHDALQAMGSGSSGTIVLAPETAFGAPGLPAVQVPEIAHLVYFLTVVGVSGSPCASSSAAEPAATATNGRFANASSPAPDKSALAKSISARYGAWTSNASSRTSFAPHAGRSASHGAGAGSSAAATRSVATAQAAQHPHHAASGSKSLHELSPEEAEAVVRARIAAMDGGNATPTSGAAGSAETPAGFRGLLGNMFGSKGDKEQEKEISIAPAGAANILPAGRNGRKL